MSNFTWWTWRLDDASLQTGQKGFEQGSRWLKECPIEEFCFCCNHAPLLSLSSFKTPVVFWVSPSSRNQGSKLESFASTSFSRLRPSQPSLPEMVWLTPVVEVAVLLFLCGQRHRGDGRKWAAAELPAEKIWPRDGQRFGGFWSHGGSPVVTIGFNTRMVSCSMIWGYPQGLET